MTGRTLEKLRAFQDFLTFDGMPCGNVLADFRGYRIDNVFISKNLRILGEAARGVSDESHRKYP
jgi:hypothetical protein